MFLTKDEEAMLDGEYGEALEIAMSVLVKMGDMYGADRMIEIENAHIDAASYTTIYDAGLQLCEKFSSLGASFKVPTTLNASAIDFERWHELCLPSSLVEKQIRLEKAYKKMGAITTWTCTPYQYGANLRFGQNVAWGESNAVLFANSVIGARTNRFGDLVDICAAIVGKVPNFGLYLEENRHGEILFEVGDLPTKSFSCADYGVLGFYVGSVAGTRVPIVKGMPKNVKYDQLKAFGAAAATSGAVALCHICGVTPEAEKLDKALRNLEPEEKVKVGINEFNEVKERLSTTGETRADVVALGCPHYSVEQLRRVAYLVKGKKVKEGVELWVFTSRVAKMLARDMGIINLIEKAGGKVIADACMLYFPLERWGFRTLMTDSVKMAYYASGLTKMNVILKNTEKCVRPLLGR